MVVAPQLLVDQRREQLRPATLDPVLAGLVVVGRTRGGEPAQQAGAAELGHDRRDDAQEAGRLASIAEQADGRPIDGRCQLGVGQVPALDAEPQRARRDRLAESVLGRWLAEVEDDGVAEAPRLAMDHVDELEAGRDRRQRAGEKSLGVGPLEQEGAPAARLQRTDRRCQAVPECGGLGAGTLRAAAEDRLEAKGLRRLATEHPRRGQVLVRQLVDAGADRW